MGLRGDQRGQAIQIGAILLFAFLVLAFAGYQAVLVPDQNAAVEAAHAQQVADDVVDLRSAVVTAWATGTTRSATVHLGTTYPPRIFAMNPSPPGGTLRTGTTGEITVEVTHPGRDPTPQPVCGSTAVTTGVLSYVPAYNEYRSPPTVSYENSVVYRRYDDAVLFDSGQLLVQNDTVNLVAVPTDFVASGRDARSVDLHPGARTNDSVNLTEPVERLDVTFPSELSAATWADLLADQPNLDAVGKSGRNVTVSLRGPPDSSQNRTYTVVCRPVGLDRAP